MIDFVFFLRDLAEFEDICFKKLYSLTLRIFWDKFLFAHFYTILRILTDYDSKNKNPGKI